MWQPSSSIGVLHFRAQLLENIRLFFKQQHVLEVETPVLSQAANSEVFIDSFISSQNGKNYYLHTSPEFAMKRLLASGSGDIFQIAKVFRQEELGSQHNPEFTLLEWYRLGFNEQDLINQVADLINQLFSSQKKNTLAIQIISYRELFLQYLSINPHTVTKLELQHCVQELKLQHNLSTKDDKDRYLELLLCCELEKYLGGTIKKPKMTFLYDYPASQASLAKIEKNQYHEKIAKRFELYIATMEIANGFYELDNAFEQSKRFAIDNQHRKALGKKIVPTDHYLIKALEHGLPSCAGVALGVDRLLMLMLEKSQISEVMSFSFERA